MAKSKELKYRADFTESIVNIQDNINKLSQIDPETKKAFQEAYDQYINSELSLNAYLDFRNHALDIKNQFRSSMDKPDTKQIVCNIVLGILGLGVIYGLAVGINYLLNDKTLFFKPAAVSRLDAVFDTIDNLKRNPLTGKLDY